ncbi:hypothetical protein EXE42_03235 [Halorubrum sp. SP3]|uniref:hypothetical protein n=1 Tax=Halorubrum sp. SP3 TaxID=1537265 RepID=UPI0010F44FD0|nr:hypothetical protein [Halorubrum sp. SP3]TKX55495.1 hypothetical protein EXE42_03235 [Halorubrum sp. SP3]
MSSETDATDADGTTDGGYVHVPDADGGEGDEPVGLGSSTADDPSADGFGRKGWALTAAIFTCALVIPGIIYVYPYAAGWFGLPFFATYLALPLVPALLLGLVAVWSMTAATADGEA